MKMLGILLLGSFLGMVINSLCSTSKITELEELNSMLILELEKKEAQIKNENN